MWCVDYSCKNLRCYKCLDDCKARTMYRYAKDRTAWVARAPPTASKLTDKTKQSNTDPLQFAEYHEYS